MLLCLYRVRIRYEKVCKTRNVCEQLFFQEFHEEDDVANIFSAKSLSLGQHLRIVIIMIHCWCVTFTVYLFVYYELVIGAVSLIWPQMYNKHETIKKLLVKFKL